jgi:hypothetical protein
MRSVQEDALEKFFKDLRRGGTYNRKWWNPIEFGMHVHDLVRYEEIPNVVEIGTGNGCSASWAALGGANVWTCDIADRPKVWDADIFPLPHLKNRVQYFVMNGNEFLPAQKAGRRSIRDLVILDGPVIEKGFRRQWTAVKDYAREGDIIVAPIGSQDVYRCFLSIREVGFDVQYSTSTEAYTVKWPADGNVRDW